MLSHFAPGGYRFIGSPGSPFSAGIVADAELDLVHATFARPVPLERGLEAAARHVEAAGRPVTALAAFELRIPDALSRDRFSAFNVPYVQRMTAMGLTTGDVMVTARTNVAPTISGVAEPSLYAFTYTVPGRTRPGPAFRLSGATETTEGLAGERLRSIVEVLSGRMAELGVTWDDSTAINVYGAEDAGGALPEVLSRVGAAGLHGLVWVPSWPPITDFAFEIDARSVGTELVL